MHRDLSRTYFREIKELYGFVVEQVNVGLFKSDIIDKMIGLGVDRMLAFDVLDEMERNLSGLRKRFISLVMSDSAEREALRKEFWISGYEVLLWDDLKKFLENIIKKVPDLVLVDAFDIDLKGRDVLGLLRTDIIGRKIPVFVLSDPTLTQKDFDQWKFVEVFERSYSCDDIVCATRKLFLNRFRSED